MLNPRQKCGVLINTLFLISVITNLHFGQLLVIVLTSPSKADTNLKANSRFWRPLKVDTFHVCKYVYQTWNTELVKFDFDFLTFIAIFYHFSLI